jgi:hypothetical protein
MNRTELISNHQRINRKFEVKYFRLVHATLQDDIGMVAGMVDAKGIHAGISYVHDMLTNGVAPIVQRLYNEVGLQYARATWRALQEQKRATRTKGPALSEGYQQKGFGFNTDWVQFIKNFLYQFLIDKITFEVTRTFRDTLLTTLNLAIEKGWGIAETVRALDELPLPRTQAARIVRTEVTRAANTGAMAAGSTFPFEQTKEWIATHDSRTRGQHPNDHASHISLDGITIDYEDVFTDPINGDELRYPGDPNGSAASVIHCRCAIAIVAKVGANGRLIPKKVKQVA